MSQLLVIFQALHKPIRKGGKWRDPIHSRVRKHGLVEGWG